MIYINITDSVLISKLAKDHSMIETRRLKNVVIFIQTTLVTCIENCATEMSPENQVLLALKIQFLQKSPNSEVILASCPFTTTWRE